MSTSTLPVAGLNGRPLGVRALEKRRLILDATRLLLEERRLRELSVADIARRVGTSPATFYQYFADVDDVVLHLSAAANEELPELLALFAGNWRGKAGQQRAREVVLFFIEYWDAHGAILRIRNLASEEGDERFMALRRAAMEPILDAMVALMARHGVDKSSGIVPGSAALAMSAILDRLAAVHTMVEREGTSQKELVGTSALILWRTLTGKQS